MKIFIFSLLFMNAAYPQKVEVPPYYIFDEELSQALYNITETLNLNDDFDVGEDGSEQISLAVIIFKNGMAHFGGVNYDNFIYPASVYKMYVAAEVLNQISQGRYTLYSHYIIKSPNDVDRAKEILSDPRPLLKDGDTVTVNYLLDLMITRSDNSAANCLIDLAKRENINALIHKYNWHGSEVTRKFLSRKYEDPGYEKIRGTETCALHAADFMYLIYKDKLVNHWVSQQLKTLLGRQLDKTKLAAGFPDNVMFYHKTGWFSFWTNDVGIVDNGKSPFIIACFLPLEEIHALEKFEKIAKNVYELINSGK